VSALTPPAAVTCTFTVPAACVGVETVICVSESTVKLVALVPPKLTSLTSLNWVPVMTTEVPPVSGPEATLSESKVGTGGVAM
jgi:hypothetical protein